jgi:hypothetical protein
MKITVLSEVSYEKWIMNYPILHKRISKNFKLFFINITGNYYQKIDNTYNKKNFFNNTNPFLYFFFKKNRQPLIFFVSESNKHLIIFFLIRFFNVPIIYINSHFNYVHSTYNYQNINLKNKIKIFFNSLNSKLFNFLLLINFYKKIDVLFTVVKEEFVAASKYKKKFFLFPYKKHKKVILINDKHIDKNYYKNIKSKNIYISFLDEAVPYHEDQLKLGYLPLDKNYYYSKLFKLFNLLEEILSCKIVVLPHPVWDSGRLNIDYNVDYLGYKVETKFKNYILKHSKLVLVHSSSAIFRAINYKRPILQIAFKGNKMINFYNDFIKKKFKLQRVYLENFNKKKIIKALKKESFNNFKRYSQSKKDNYSIISNYLRNNYFKF